MKTALTSDADVLKQIEEFCDESGMGVTTFGRKAIGDANLVSNLRAGRSLTLKTANAVLRFIAAQRDPPAAAA
jgi:hypothetical protein